MFFTDFGRKGEKFDVTIKSYDDVFILENGASICADDKILNTNVAQCNEIYKNLSKLNARDFARGFINQISSKFSLETIFEIKGFKGFEEKQSFHLQKFSYRNITFLHKARLYFPIIADRMHNRLAIRKSRIIVCIYFKHLFLCLSSV